MADFKPTTTYYQNLGGVNQKVGKYDMSMAQFLDLRNLDFDVPNALQKRPGSALAGLNQLTGPVISTFEFQKLTGQSWVIAHDSNALWNLNGGVGGNFSLLSTGWTSPQPADMLTFVNRAWMANGQKFQSWDGSTVLPAGLPCPLQGVSFFGATAFVAGASVWTVFGSFTMAMTIDQTQWQGVAVHAAYSYLRTDGYYGPLDFLYYSKNIIGQSLGFPTTSGNNVTSLVVSGFTVPSASGITSIAIWLGFFPWTAGNFVNTFGHVPFAIPGDSQGQTLTQALLDKNQFYLYTTIPATQLTATINFGGVNFSSIATAFNNNAQFSGVPFCWFNTNTPKYIEIGQNTMFSAGFSQSPSTVWISEVGFPEQYSVENTFEVRSNDGDRLFAQKAFNNQVVLMKEHSFHKLIGNSPDTYQLIEVSLDYGCLSNKTVIAYKQSLLWLDRKGIISYNGASFDVISTPVEGVFRRMNINAAKENAVAVHHLYRNQIWFGIPVDGSSINNLTVVYDYAIGAWTFFDGFNPASFSFSKSNLSKPTVWRGDYSGFVHYFGESFFNDSGQGITCLAFTHFENIGGQNQTTLWRRLFLDSTPATGTTGQIQGQVFSNYDTSAVQATFAAYQSSYQTRFEMGVQGKAVAAQFSHSSASLPLLINGYAWANRPLRNV